jgi:hypothetical protein
MNKAAMRTQVADFVGDKNLTRYPSDQYDRALDRSQEQFALDSHCLWEDEPFTTAIGTATYNLPDDFMWEEFATYDGKELTPISQHELQVRAGEDWANEQGPPSHVLVNPAEGAKTFRLWPTPQEVKTGVLRYYPLPASLSSDASVPLNSTALLAQFHIGICAYAAWLLLMSEDETPAIGQKIKRMERLYSDVWATAQALFKDTASAPIKIRGNRKWS